MIDDNAVRKVPMHVAKAMVRAACRNTGCTLSFKDARELLTILTT